MDCIIIPGTLSGTVTPPCSKSLAHRMLLAAALSGETSILTGIQLSRDLNATLDAVTVLGAKGKLEGTTLTLQGIQGGSCRGTGLPKLDCGQSGTTLRLLLPVALVTAGGGCFTMESGLARRPMTPYEDLFSSRNIRWNQQGGTLTVQGTLTSGEYALPGNVSSQFFSGLLFALALVPGESRLISTTPLESASYVDMTLEVLKIAGIQAGKDGPGRFWVQGSSFRPLCQRIEADWSQGAFWLTAHRLGNPVEVAGLHPDSVQGDRVFLTLAKRLSEPGDCMVDLSQCPDLLPPLAVLAANREAETRFAGARRLRYKESDRLTAVKGMLDGLGVWSREESDGLTVRGGNGFSGGRIDGCGDHRIVMAAAIAAAAAREPVTLLGSEAVEKSYPAFWREFERLGGKCHVL